MGGHGHGEPYTVPHPSCYKVENVPQLLKVKEALGRQGLNDPWLRNEAWRYEKKGFGTHGSRLSTFMFRGLGVGFCAVVATIAIEYALGIGKGQGDHGHGHGDKKDH
ncbi:NADH dehydrogenase [ubiquinone] 1 beta subcomplex subunit 3 [Drosophila hydei]|uniref:NADH dehydrogenase [ubiquinone] 1 beta subcomplex subunit 3 n=1 Tax=Drosophila hydei TaxID=7224 RepID=A0A6J1L9F0_DROHY|nr:NADH dehydrogenase [ubiquinone] 1 beta subcomplex subunit 3 [Drosophila hydei]XP_023161673.2 NADH dehydrogenase [ubiquinone] 1 beta subcomplex subunit 3 [Drosophila hydei]